MSRLIELVLTGPVGDVVSSTRIEVKSYGLDGEELAVDVLRNEFRKRRKETETQEKEEEHPQLFRYELYEKKGSESKLG